jgi:hypothetical protein
VTPSAQNAWDDDAIVIAFERCGRQVMSLSEAKEFLGFVSAALQERDRLRDTMDDALRSMRAGRRAEAEEYLRAALGAGFESQEAMRAGPRAYTPDQAEVITQTVRTRRPLPESPLPVDEREGR